MSEVKGGKKSTKVRKLYPGYVFINMCLYDAEKQVIIKPFYFVKDAGGVIGFVGGDKPAALRQAEIDEIKARIEAASGKEIPKVHLRGRRGSEDHRRRLRQPHGPRRRGRPRPR